MAVLRFTYGDEARDLDVTTMLMSEAESCEKLTGWTEDEWRTEMAEGKVAAVRFAWWLAGKRAGVEERYSSIDLDLRKIGYEVVLTDEEKAAAESDTEADAGLPTGPDGDQESAG